MKSILINILVMAVQRLLGSMDWNRVFEVVKTLGFSGLSGEQKRQEALGVLCDSLKGVETWLLNLAIEIAVAKLKTLK